MPTTLQTPDKLLAKQNSRSVQHSRSVTDLKQAQTTTADDSKLGGSENERERRKENKNKSKRRRSTLPWSGVTPGVRQTRLEDIACSRMADTWFSLHCDGISEPVYISEVVERAMNPSFKGFDLNIYGPTVSRQHQATFKFWAKTPNMEEYFLLLEMSVDLRSLQYIGKTLDNFHQPLPANCVIFHLADGVYASLTDVPSSDKGEQSGLRGRQPGSRDGEELTSSYDALMRLANLDDCIQDALATREKLEAQINQLLRSNHTNLATLDKTSQAEERLSAVKRSCAAERSRLRRFVRHRDDIVASLKARREAMAKSRQDRVDMEGRLVDAEASMKSSEDLLAKTTDDSMNQVRRICEDLISIYPIEAIRGKPLAFTILNIHLPNSNFTDINKDSVAAALGYTAHLVYLLSFYIAVPLPYPIHPYLSNSYINDPISVDLSQRTFPLYPINAHYRFEYGVFLLNKDIEYLMNRLGLRVLDIRHTLPNLKYLLYMLTSGTSELPARKAGGIRGLLSAASGVGAGISTPTLSRRQSEDSTVTVSSGPRTSHRGGVGGAATGAGVSASSSERLHTPSPPPHKLNGGISQGWQVGAKNGRAAATTMPTAAATAVNVFAGFGRVK